MKWNKQTSVFLFVGILFTLPLLIPLLPKTIAIGWDMTAHLARIWALHKALNDGSFPPRWSSYLAFGYGSPVLMFNWSLPYYLGDLLLRCGASLFTAFQGVSAITIVASYVTMYIFLSCLAAPQWALVGALFFAWAPYRFDVLYLRGAIGESMSVIFWPIILLSILFLFKKEYWKGLFVGSAACALSILAHHVLFLMITPVFILLTLLRFFQTKNHTALLVSACTILFGTALTSYFWIPAFFEKKFIGFSTIQSLYQDNFLLWQTLVNNPWFNIFKQDFPYLYRAIGWPQLAAIALSVIIILRACIYKNMQKHIAYIVFFLAVSIGAIFLLTHASLRFWQRLPFLSSFVYPNRFLGLIAFTTGVLITLALSRLANKKNQTLLFLLALLFTIACNVPYVMLNKATTPVDVNTLNTPILNTTDMAGEFMPKTIPENFIRNAEWYESVPLLTVISGNASVGGCTQKSSTITCSLTAQTPATVRLRQFYFPGWVVYGNKQRIPLKMDANDGTIRIDVPAHTTTITASFQNTPLRTFANWLTILSLGVYGVLVVVSLKKILRKKLD